MQGPAMQRRIEVLFADDDPFYCELAKSTLEDAGYAVTTAVNGLAALATLAERPLRLAIIDLEMPGLDGFEVIERVRAEGPNQAMPVIVLTGHDNEASVDRAYKAGATSFMVKPVNWQLFVQHVRFVLKAAQSEAELRETSRTARFLSDLKSQVLSTLVNEFQSPLRGAFSSASLLKHEADGPLASPLYAQAAADLYKTLEQLSSVHARMLNFGRVLGESIPVEETLWPLQPLLVEAVAVMREPADRRQIELELTIALPATTEMRGDKALVNQTIKGILAHAIRFAPRGSVVAIDARVDEAGGFLLAVTDDAPCLSVDQIRETLALPAPPKSRPDDGLHRAGMTIGRLLVEAHQGELSLQARPENGNVATMAIPAARIRVDAMPREARAQPARSVPIAVKQAGLQRLSLALPRRPGAVSA